MLSKNAIPSDPIAVCLELFGGPWKLRIASLLVDENRPFKYLLKNIDGITSDELLQCLQELQDADLVKRIIGSGEGVQATYGLTLTGDTLEPVINELRQWGTGYQRMVEAFI